MQRTTAMSAAFVIAIIMLASFSVYESFQVYDIGSQNSSLRSQVSSFGSEVSSLNGQVSNLSGRVLLLSQGITTLEGKTYWTVTIALSNFNFSQVTFAGVTFTLNFMKQGGCMIVNGQVLSLCYGTINATGVYFPCPSAQSSNSTIYLCGAFLPQIRVSYSDGYYEYFNRVSVVRTTGTETFRTMNNQTWTRLRYNLTNWVYSPPGSYPWIGRHTNPQVAIVLRNQSNVATLTFYVSV